MTYCLKDSERNVIFAFQKYLKEPLQKHQTVNVLVSLRALDCCFKDNKDYVRK